MVIQSGKLEINAFILYKVKIGNSGKTVKNRLPFKHELKSLEAVFWDHCSYIHQWFNAAKNLFSMPNIRTVSVSLVRYTSQPNFPASIGFQFLPVMGPRSARGSSAIIKPTNEALNIGVVFYNSLIMFFSYQLPNFKPRGTLHYRIFPGFLKSPVSK